MIQKNDNPFEVGSPEPNEQGRWLRIATRALIMVGVVWIAGFCAYWFWMSDFRI